MKTFRKGCSILDTIKDLNDSWKEVKISTLKRVWKKVFQLSWMTLRDSCFSEEVTSGMMQITGELELRMEHEDTTALLQSHVKLKQMRNCFL